ncbi:MAG TPA: DUF5677 domain-containing protein [Nitrososphaera sp.]|nr:DUF5677 domain-containing protein [Nitrososphaera sp.]
MRADYHIDMLSSSAKPCSRLETEHVRRFIADAKRCLNEARYYPQVNGYRYMVALALYSKCTIVAEAVLVLIVNDFGDEAFGMTRTLVDIFFTLRYITNNDTDVRAKRYADFCAKDSVVWNEVTKAYWPHHTQTIPNNILAIASNYPSPHSWSGKTAKEMALEPDTIEMTLKRANHSLTILLIKLFIDGPHTTYILRLVLLNPI